MHEPGGVVRVVLLHLLHAIDVQRIRSACILCRRILDRRLRRMLHGSTCLLHAVGRLCRGQKHLSKAHRGAYTVDQLSSSTAASKQTQQPGMQAEESGSLLILSDNLGYLENGLTTGTLSARFIQPPTVVPAMVGCSNWSAMPLPLVSMACTCMAETVSGHPPTHHTGERPESLFRSRTKQKGEYAHLQALRSFKLASGTCQHLHAVVAVVQHAHEVPGEGVRLRVHGLIPGSAYDLLRPQQPHCSRHTQNVSLSHQQWDCPF